MNPECACNDNKQEGDHMLRVIIADDEERICKLIQILADWEKLGMEVVGVAGNGPEALSLTQALSPDILITDIRMPGMDGLELIHRAKQAVPSLEVIIISGYAQFDYAQTAIQYGVGDYLLKPVNRDVLCATLEKMAERSHARRSSAQLLERAKHTHPDDRERRRQNLIHDLIDGRYRETNAELLAQHYAFSGHGDCYQAMILKLDCDADRFTEPSLEILRNKISDIFSPVLGEICADFLIGARGSRIYAAMNYPSPMRTALRGRLRDCLNQLVEMRDLFGPVVFTLALGQAAQSLSMLPNSFADANSMIAERLIEGTERLLEGPAPLCGTLNPDILARYAQEAAHAIDVLNEESADCAADSLAYVAMNLPDAHGLELLELTRSAGLLFVTQLGIEDKEHTLDAYAARLDQCSTAVEAFAVLRALQRTELERAAERRRNQSGQPIRLAKQYIQHHFADPLTLEAVSTAIGFSPNYFSTLFKRETGEGFAKYLARIRMEEARSLLRESRLPVAEICRRVGYEDIKHFTRTFKQESGITPGEFRKLYG